MVSSSTILIVRVDPARQIVAAKRMPCGRNALRDVKREVRADPVGWHKLQDIDDRRLMGQRREGAIVVTFDAGPTPLVAAGGLNMPEETHRWRLAGCVDHAGIGILFGQGTGGGMIDVPVSADWVRERIIWLPGESVAQLAERAAEILPSLPSEVRDAVAAAIDSGPVSTGDTTWWLPIDRKPIFPAMIRLGLGEESTGGQRLTKLGAAVRELAAGSTG